MTIYLKFFKQKIYLGVLLVFCCACFGSIRGAWKESMEPYIWITEEDVIKQQSGESAPILTGIMALAAEQNRWYNFDYAIIYGGRGIILYCLLLALYLPYTLKKTPISHRFP